MKKWVEQYLQRAPWKISICIASARRCIIGFAGPVMADVGRRQTNLDSRLDGTRYLGGSAAIQRDTARIPHGEPKQDREHRPDQSCSGDDNHNAIRGPAVAEQRSRD